MRIEEAIPYVDMTYGLDVPVVVIGYSCLVRCCSVRSKHRVITHSIVNPADSQHMGNMHQMFMRAAGMTKHVRELLDFGNVKLLCREHDFQLLRRLYEFTSTVLRKAGTGTHEGLRVWSLQEYDDVFEVILDSWRKFAPPGLHKHWPIERWRGELTYDTFIALHCAVSKSSLLSRYLLIAGQNSITVATYDFKVGLEPPAILVSELSQPHFTDIETILRHPDTAQAIANPAVDIFIGTGFKVFSETSTLFQVCMNLHLQ
jgi:hypothetical protein